VVPDGALFVAATIAYMFEPNLANNKWYLVIIMLVVFWGMTLANFLGLKNILRFNNAPSWSGH